MPPATGMAPPNWSNNSTPSAIGTMESNTAGSTLGPAAAAICVGTTKILIPTAVPTRSPTAPSSPMRCVTSLCSPDDMVVRR